MTVGATFIGTNVLFPLVPEQGEKVRRLYDLELARDRNPLFSLSWTAIHPITQVWGVSQHTYELSRDTEPCSYK